MDDEELDQLISGQESPQDKWLTNEEYASGKWWRFALERLLSVILATRFTTQMLEYMARAGFNMYVPVMTWQLRMVNANPLADDAQAFMLVLDDEGHPTVLRDGRPVIKQGPDLIYSFLAGGEFELNRGQKGRSTRLFNSFIRKPAHYFLSRVLLQKSRDGQERRENRLAGLRARIEELRNSAPVVLGWIAAMFAMVVDLLITLSGDQKERISDKIREFNEELLKPGPDKIRLVIYETDEEVVVFIHKKHLQRARMWVPTPILASGLLQAPRLPFEMIPNWDLDETYLLEMVLRNHYIEQAEVRNQLVLSGIPCPELPGEFVRWQDCGVPGLDAELLRWYRLGKQRNHGHNQSREPRLNKLPRHLQELVQAGVKLWDLDDAGEIIIPRWLEDEAGVTERVHREVAGRYVTAKQVYEGMEETKRRVVFEIDPAGILTIVQRETVLGRLLDVQQLPDTQKERVIRYFLTHLMNNGQEERALELQAKIREYLEGWIGDNYDLKQPNLQYHYREVYYDTHQIHTGSWASQADRWHNMIKTRVHMKSPPRVVSSTSQWADFLEMDLFVADFESWRNIEHMQAHWQSTKAGQNEMASMDATKNAIHSLRSRDWGGIWQSRKASSIWRWRKMDAAAPVGDPRREQLFGPAWAEKEPWETIDHDGVMMDRFGQGKAGWVGMMVDLKGYSSSAGRWSFKKRDKLEEDVEKYRDYDSEWAALRNDEYYGYDPVDCVENQKAVVILSVLRNVNVRLNGRFRHHPSVRLTYDNCYMMQTWVVWMWKHLPTQPRVKWVEEKIASWEHENEEHWRPELNKIMEGIHRSPGRFGLNKYFTGFYRRRGQENLGVEDPRLEILIINRKPIKNSAGVYERRQFEQDWEWVKGWYERSDDRLDNFLYKRIAQGSQKGPGGASGAYNFDVKQASRDNEEGYGTGYGTLAEQDERQMRRVEIGLQAKYYQTEKSIIQWFSMKLTQHIMPDFDDEGVHLQKGRVTLDDVKDKVLSAITSGDILWLYAQYRLWPKLRRMAPEILNEDFPSRHRYADVIDDEFIRHQLNYLVGPDSRPSRKDFLDKKVDAAELEPIIMENRQRYQRILDMRFNEINEHHDADEDVEEERLLAA